MLIYLKKNTRYYSLKFNFRTNWIVYTTSKSDDTFILGYEIEAFVHVYWSILAVSTFLGTSWANLLLFTLIKFGNTFICQYDGWSKFSQDFKQVCLDYAIYGGVLFRRHAINSPVSPQHWYPSQILCAENVMISCIPMCITKLCLKTHNRPWLFEDWVGSNSSEAHSKVALVHPTHWKYSEGMHLLWCLTNTNYSSWTLLEWTHRWAKKHVNGQSL